MTDFSSKIVTGWRESAGDSWLDYVDHEFVRGLGDGSLPRQAFIAYLIQDYLFLMHFSRAWALAVVKSETVEQMRAASATVHALVNEEIQLHIGICKREGVTEAQLQAAEEAPENLAYTRYVLDAGLCGDLLDLLATLAPCVFGYGEIGQKLAGSKNTTPVYRQWIDCYSGEDYKSVCLASAELIEQVAFSKLGNNPTENPRWASLCKRFLMATKLEAGFWSMGLRLGLESSYENAQE